MPGPKLQSDALGLAVADLGGRARQEQQVPADRSGVVIQAVIGADPGTDLLAEGDLVVEVNRQPTPDLAAYRRVLASLEPGRPAWVFVFRPQPPGSRGSFLTRIEVEDTRR